MKLKDVSLPEIYKESQDFRFFLKWFELCLSQIQYDTENVYDLYDPLRCKTNLLWMLADTMGFKYDNRQYPAFNRLVLLYFMNMIRNRGSQDGMLIAGQVNLAGKSITKKFSVIDTSSDPQNPRWEERWEDLEDAIYQDRLYSDVLPTNSVSVVSNPAEGYIDVVYFADSLPTDSCIEYARPLGMYCCQTPGVKYDARSRISVDARLVDDLDDIYPPGPARVADYIDSDYASLQGYDDGELTPRNKSYYRNSTYEGRDGSEYIKPDTPNGATVDAGYRTLYSLQLSNTESNMRSALSGNNQADILMGTNWVDTGVSLRQLADEFNWNLPEPEIPVNAIDTEDTSEIQNTVEIQNTSSGNNMGSLGDSLV